MGFVSLGKTNNKNNLSKIGGNRFSKNFDFWTKSEPLNYKKMTRLEFETFKSKLDYKRNKEIRNKILFGIVLSVIFIGFTYEILFQ